jgi:hypothetical protein
MGKRDGRQKGAQTHAEGQHGRKAHSHLIEQLQETSPRREGRQAQGEPDMQDGGHRLHQRRQQYDHAEFNSEKNRAVREVERGTLDPEDPGVRERTNGMRG